MTRDSTPGGGWGNPPATVAEFLRPGTPRVIAHRGFSARAPENTLAACRRALEVQPDMLEVDLQLSRDGHVVLHHDPTLERTTNGSGALADRTLAELRRLDAGSWFSDEFVGEPLPTLEEALELVADRCLLNLELKPATLTHERRGTMVERVVAAVRAHGLASRVLISSFEPGALEEARHLAPEVARASLFNRRLHLGMDPVEILDQVESLALALSDSLVTGELVERCRQSGRPVLVYTVNEPQRMRQLFALGVHGLFTDWPDVLVELRQQIASGAGSKNDSPMRRARTAPPDRHEP